MRILKNQNGFALILVMSMVLVLTITMEIFMTNTSVNREIVGQARQRLQAYYLAKSSLNISKLFLAQTKQLESKYAKFSSQMRTYLGGQPLYKQIPLSTALLRGLMGDQDGGTDETVVPQEDTADQTTSESPSSFSQISELQRDDAEEFLAFDGNFSSEIVEEQAKFSLNIFSKITSESPSYDLYKKILQQILLGEDFKSFFSAQEQEAEVLTHAIVDYVDVNEMINEYDKVERGQENSIYKGVDYEPKNGLYLTNSELRLIPGMNDEIFQKLSPLVSVFHTDSKINVCLADSRIVDALIIYYTDVAECTQSLRDADQEKLDELRTKMLEGCLVSLSEVANLLNLELGLKNDNLTDSASSRSKGGNQTQTAGSSRIPGCKVQFEDLISETNNIIKISAKGEVNNIAVTMTEVVDISAKTPNKWKTLYYFLE